MKYFIQIDFVCERKVKWLKRKYEYKDKFIYMMKALMIFKTLYFKIKTLI